MRYPAAPACALAIVALLSTGCDVKVGEGGLSFDIVRGKASEEWVRSYTLAKGGRLEVVNVNGTIEVAPATDGKVEVKALREAKAASDEAARELLKKVQIEDEVGPRSVKVEARGDWSGKSFGLHGGSSLSVRYNIRIPPGLTVLLKTENGGVRLDNVAGVITASTTNGGINGRDVSGTLSAATVNGGVQIDMTTVSGPVELVAVNGGVRLELAPDVNAQLEASAVNGGVSVDDELPLAASEQERRRVVGRINAGGPLIVARTTNGGVRVSAREPRP